MPFTAVRDEEWWNQIVQELPGHSIYQAWSWGEYRERRGVGVHRYALIEGGRPLAGAAVEIRRMRRLPWCVGYAPAGPLWASAEALHAFLGHLRPELSRMGVLHLKVNPRGSQVSPAVLRREGFLPVDARPGQTFGGILPLETAVVDLAQSCTEPDARRRVRQAARRGVGVSAEAPEDALEEFYRWLRATSLRQVFWLPAAEMLREMLEVWAARGEAALLVARHGGACIGGAICSFFGDEAMGHFIADDPGSRHLSAVYALYAAGLAEASRRGCRYMDLGGIRAGDDGLHGFKRQFGAGRLRHAGEWNLPLRPGWYGLLDLVSQGRLRHTV